MKEDRNSPPEKETIKRGHETDTVSPRLMIVSGLGIAVLVVFSLILASLMVHGRVRQAADFARRKESPQEAHGVRFTANQPQQLEELREAERQKLNQYEWIDRPEGVARIPIDRAIDILATQGLPKNTPKPEKDDAKTQPE